jgi:hypothetical protein
MWSANFCGCDPCWFLLKICLLQAEKYGKGARGDAENEILTYTDTYQLTYLLTELTPSLEGANYAATQELPRI